MGTLIRAWKTRSIPPGATISKNIVTWKAKGKKKTGKLSGLNKVSVQVDTWTARFTDMVSDGELLPRPATVLLKEFLPNMRPKLTGSSPALLHVRNWSKYRSAISRLQEHWKNIARN